MLPVRHSSAFTLIELLIVVAIVAILAAIAVPNFLEAQTRAKTARVRADMRTLAVGLESYYVDNNAYVQPTGNGIPSRLWHLSTPIAYLTRPRMSDAFNDVRAGAIVDHEIEYWGCNNRRTALASTAAGDLIENRLGGGEPRVMWYFLRSAGPDCDVNAEGAGYETWLAPDDFVAYIYDPTNGTLSFGEIFRVGGEVAPDFLPSASLAIQAQ
jgi:prepilin-type N-terminal cleavage/methylation domain-containing protein